jgi:hypothetical protein
MDLNLSTHLPAELREETTGFGFLPGGILRGRLDELLQAAGHTLGVERCREIPTQIGVVLRHYWL